MRDLYVRPRARADLIEGAEWYEAENAGLGSEFLGEADRVINIIRHREVFVTAPYEIFPAFLVRRVFFKRFPFRAFFVETDAARDVVAFLRDGREEARWRERL